jgi:site-specific DNA recombinase
MPPKTPSPSAAIYARYSSDNQSEASIEDQVRVCRRYAELQGFTVIVEYADDAISGASTLRPGYQKLLEGARKAAFDIVLAEGLDRLSRDLADVATLHKHCPTSASACGRWPRARSASCMSASRAP